MNFDDLAFLSLKAIRTEPSGKRTFEPEGKRRLIEACLQPGMSISGMALKAGINVNSSPSGSSVAQTAISSLRNAATRTTAGIHAGTSDRQPGTTYAAAARLSALIGVAVTTVGASTQWREGGIGMYRARCCFGSSDDCGPRSALMFRLDADSRVYRHRELIDFRAGMNSLVTLVEKTM